MTLKDLSKIEPIVYNDNDFWIIQHIGAKTPFVYQVIPIDNGKPITDYAICPEPSTLAKAKLIVEKNRKSVRKYKENQ